MMDMENKEPYTAKTSHSHNKTTNINIFLLDVDGDNEEYIKRLVVSIKAELQKDE